MEPANPRDGNLDPLCPPVPNARGRLGQRCLHQTASRHAPTRIVGFRAALLLAFFWLIVFPATAGQFDDEIARITHNAEAAGEISEALDGMEGNLVAVPVPIVDPTLGSGLALTALYTFAASDEADTPRSTVGAAAGYTDTDSWLAGVGAKFYLHGDRLRLGAVAGYGRLNLRFFGIGNDRSASGRSIDFTAQGGFAEVTAQAQVLADTFLGVKGRYLQAEVSSELPIDGLPRLTTDFRLLGVGPTFEFDTRDDNWWPAEGTRATGELLLYAEEIGSDVGFASFDASIAHYFGLAERVVLAGKARAAASSNDAPFFMRPFISLRGFAAGELLDAAVGEVQVEMRWRAWNRLGIVAFGGVGTTGSGLDALALDESEAAVGAGLRYRVSDTDRMNIGIDLAFGDGDAAVYFRIGEAF